MELALWILVGLGAATSLLVWRRQRTQRLLARERLTSASLAGALPLQIFGAMFSVAGFGMMYYAVCLFKNHTRIEVLDSELTRSYGPLPWPKFFQGNPVKIPVSEITSVWTERYQSGRNDQGVRATLYCVKVSTREGEDVNLAWSFTRPEPAAFIKQKLQESLGCS